MARSQLSGHEFWSRDTHRDDTKPFLWHRSDVMLFWWIVGMQTATGARKFGRKRVYESESEPSAALVSHSSQAAVEFYARRKLRVIAVKYKTRASFTFLVGMWALLTANTQDLTEHVIIWEQLFPVTVESPRSLQTYLDPNPLNPNKERILTLLSTREIKAFCNRENTLQVHLQRFLIRVGFHSGSTGFFFIGWNK